MHRFLLTAIVAVLLSAMHANAQEKKISLRDTLDHKFDVSSYLIDMHGFVPWPVIISEPALGNFGVALALAFISPQKKAEGDEQYHFPTITGLAGMYTANKSWGIGAMRQSTFPKIGMRYTVVAGYVDVNMSLYREIQHFGRQEFKFEMKPVVVNLDVSENILQNKIFLGLNYQFMRMKANSNFTKVSDSIFNSYEYNKNVGILGGYLELDYRDNIFTPDRGVRFMATYSVARPYLGSDFTFDKFDIFANVFIQPAYRWVMGLKGQWTAVDKEAPFYSLPYLMMRGMPMMGYQGNEILTFETEQRVDITKRWSLLGFVGTGRTFSQSRFLNDDNWYYAGGGGFRYLISRIFKLRMGVDVARGPDQWAYYIVFGHYWNFK